MHVNFGPRGILQIDDARITFRNFEGRADKYNREGDRNFALIIPNQEICNALVEDKNEHGVGWNVKIKPPRDVDDEPFMYLPVKVKFNGRGPNVYLQTGKARNRLDEGSIGILDDVYIQSLDLDIRPYDDVINGKPFRTAYLQSMHVVQDTSTDRFAARFAEDDF